MPISTGHCIGGRRQIAAFATSVPNPAQQARREIALTRKDEEEDDQKGAQRVDEPGSNTRHVSTGHRIVGA
eukprot:2709318-Rhodomonas_salina.2